MSSIEQLNLVGMQSRLGGPGAASKATSRGAAHSCRGFRGIRREWAAFVQNVAAQLLEVQVLLPKSLAEQPAEAVAATACTKSWISNDRPHADRVCAHSNVIPNCAAHIHYVVDAEMDCFRLCLSLDTLCLRRPPLCSKLPLCLPWSQHPLGSDLPSRATRVL